MCKFEIANFPNFRVLGNLLRIDNLIVSFRNKDEGSLRNFDYKKEVGEINHLDYSRL